MFTKKQTYEKIKELVEKFEEYISTYKHTDYNETQTRIEFINPFWEALGWDVDNTQKKPPHNCEVLHEVKQRQGTANKRPDYLFQKEAKKMFFYVETKKPSVNLLADKQAAFQLKRYGRFGKMKISILMDFEEFCVYNCTKKPFPNQDAKISRLDYFTFQEYLTNFDFFWNTFAKENVFAGSIDVYLKDNKEITNKESVDIEFLDTIEKWRLDLATSLNKKNPKLEDFEINFAVQQTIDRIIFLKIAEDRGLENANQLLDASKKGDIYSNLLVLFEQADKSYNSGLFNFKKDTITPRLITENKIIKLIIQKLYEEGSFDFSAIEVEILGYAYEQFLGKVIVFDDNKVASIQTKIEVRKAGGVYYTPQYIVDYIVENTLGIQIKGKNPSEITLIKIIDPSCGSGSFLLGAYQYLLNYHLEYYTKEKEKNGFSNALNANNTLKTAIKKQILVNNIFGIDIDTQAVEVSKLSLLIKCMEGETAATVLDTNLILKESVLPSLEENIFAGNSLIASDFYDGGLFLTKKEERKINVFDWKKYFKNVMSLGGFDCMIGNPPYGANFSDLEKQYLKNKHKYSDIEIESYILFLEKSFDFLKTSGFLGYIIPSNLFTNQRYEKIRSLLLNNSQINYLLDLGDGVFKEAAVDTCITIFSKQIPNFNHSILGYVGNSIKNIDYNTFLQNDFKKSKYALFNIYTSSEANFIAQKIAEKGELLENLVTFARGVEFGYKSEYTTQKAKTKNAKPLIAGRCIDKYKITFENRYVIFDEKDVSNFKTREIYEQEKILIRRIGTNIIATYDNEKYYNVCDVYNLLSKNISLKYILGFLNSKLMSFYLQTQFKNAKKIFPKIPIAYLKQLPIIVLNPKDKNEKLMYEKIILYVETLIELKKRLSEAKTNSDKRSLNDRFLRNQEELDDLIFDLYALTSEEKEIILGE